MAKVRPIPEGHHTVQPYLVVPSSAEAIAFYQKAFGAREIMRMRGPDGRSIMHAEIRIGDSVVYLADENPHFEQKSARALGGSPVSLMLYVEDADRFFERAVAAGAQVKMPVADMFWGDRFGKLVDPFGLQWAVATHKEDLSQEEVEKRGREFFAKMAKGA